MDKRLEDLEIRFAFQEDLIRQLDEVLQAQATRIDQLEGELKEVRAQIAHTPGKEASTEEQVPPHWGTVG